MLFYIKEKDYTDTNCNLLNFYIKTKNVDFRSIFYADTYFSLKLARYLIKNFNTLYISTHPHKKENLEIKIVECSI